MLSSLGARRDRSRSPPEVPPPSKIFIQTKGKGQQLNEPTQHLKINTLPAHSSDTLVPSIVVQEYREETMKSPPLLFNPEEGVTASPPQSQMNTRSETSAEAQEQDHTLQLQDQNTRNVNEDFKQETQTLKQKPAEEQVTKVDRQQVEQSCKEAGLFQDQQVQELKTSNQKTAAKKASMSTKELQSRKIQAMKNRPWLQKAASGQQRTQSSKQESASSPGETRKHQDSTKQTQQRKEEQQRQTHPPPRVKQQKEKLQQEKEQQQKNPKLQSGVREATKAKLQSVSKAQPNSRVKPSQSSSASKPQSAVQPLGQPNSSKDNQPAVTMQLTEMRENQPQTPHLPQPQDSLKVQLMTQPPTQLNLPPGAQLQPVSAGREPPAQPQGPAHAPAFAQLQTWPQIPSSPQAHIQTPVPSHVQLRSHPQTWAPVRPPSPKPLTHVHSEGHVQSFHVAQNFPVAGSHVNLQASFQHQTQPQLMSQSQVQVCPPSMGHSQGPSETRGQAYVKPSTAFSQPEAKPHQIQPLPNLQIQERPTDHRPLHSVTGPVGQWSTHANTPPPQQGLNPQGQMQVWTQVKASPSMCVQGPQAAAQHQLYPQAQISSQQWAEKQQQHNIPISQQRHPGPQPYSQQSTAHSQTFAAASQQWPKQALQVNPNEYSHMGAFYGQPPTHPQRLSQTWTQTQPPNLSQGTMSQPPQMGAYNVLQKDQGLSPPQSGVQGMPQVRHQPEVQHFLPVQCQPQTQQYPQSQRQIQSKPSDPLHSPFTSMPQLQARIQTQLLLPTKPGHQGPSPSLLQKPTPHSQLSQPTLQPSNQPKPLLKSDASPQAKPLVQLPPPAELEPTSIPQIQTQIQNWNEFLLQSQVQMPGKYMASPPNKPEAEVLQQVRVQAKAEGHPSTQPTLESVRQVPKQRALTKSEVEATPQSPVQPGATSQLEVQSLPGTTAESQIQAETQTVTRPKPQDHQPLQNQHQTQTTGQVKVQFPPETRADPILSQSKSQSEHSVRPRSQQPQASPPLKVNMPSKIQAESADFQKAPALAQAPPQAYTEAYSRAQALARNGFEEAKRCLQTHILDIINVFQEKSLPAEQSSVKQVNGNSGDDEFDDYP